MRTWIVIFSAVALLGIASDGLTQTVCENALAAARKSFDQGDFESVPVELASCLDARPSRATTIEVRSLLARAWLMADNPEKARKEVSAILRLDPTFEGGQPPRFAELVAQVKREEQTTQVASVSKTNESLREAPATVVVVTADEIQRRGYLDLEQLLHDLPGFDISRLNGDIYSNIYQRGYRSPNDRLLFLIDGVEQNELSSGILYLSRQYPLTNIDRVEVIYGPASTMYGANAYTGVISILTRDAERIVPENHMTGFAGQVTGGGYGAQYTDITAAGRDRNGAIAWSVAASVQQSKERDLSGLSDWDYSYRDVDYATKLNLFGTRGRNFRLAGLCATPSPYFVCTTAGNLVELTPAGVAHLRDIDSAFVRDNGLGFDDRAKNWSIYGKLRISNVTVGFESWRSQEGIASQYRAVDLAGNTSWIPKQTAFYLKYSIPLDRVKVNFFARYEQTGIDDASRFAFLHNFASTLLPIAALAPECLKTPLPAPCQAGPQTPWVEQLRLGSRSNQLRSEVTASYAPSLKLDTVAGLELAKSSIQSQLQQIASGAGPLVFFDPVQQPRQTEHTDIGLFAQASWKPWRTLKLVAAGRLTHNQINTTPSDSKVTGFGTLFTPRVAVIYSPVPNRLALKAIYSEAFKDPTDAQKFGVVSRVNKRVSDGLTPETVRNIELCAGWEPGDRMAFDGSLYQASYADVVSLVSASCPNPSAIGCFQYRNRDTIRVRGAQATARYRRGNAELWGNVTHTEPFLLHPLDNFGEPLTDDSGAVVSRLRTADITGNRINTGIDTLWHDRLRAGVRFHYAGSRVTRDAPDDPLIESRLASHTTADVVISDSKLLPHAVLQLIAYNIFDKQYADPGTDPQIGALRVPQAGRTVYLRLVYRTSP